jgi:hypothetical protein
MYQIFNGKIVITVNDWLAAGLTKNMLWKDSSDGYLEICQRGINENSLIDVKSIKRPERLKVIEAAYGTIHKVDATTGYRIELDSEALSFFRSYRYDDNKSLPESIIEQYHHEASILNTLEKVYKTQQIARKKYGKGKRIKMNEFWNDCVSFCQKWQEEYRHNLPTSDRHFERKYKKYITLGYESLIHKGYGNKYTEKLTEEAKDWLIARYASQIDKCTVFQLFVEYNEKAALTPSWKEIKDEKTIRNFLYKPEIKPYWYGSRYGELKSKEKYTRQHKTLLPTMRDSLWYGDGTKLNFYYIDENGSISTCNVYEVMDVYSECLLGYHVSKNEDFEAQYRAYKMAMIFSGYKPYEICFDNQGGHKKLQAGTFFKGLSRLAIHTQPYNGRSKTIESAFGRYQSQFMHKEWFFTGMNITAKKIESRPNMEFVLANKENIKSLNDTIKEYKKYREIWNQAPHPKTGISREKMYRSSSNEKSKKIDIHDMISMFGVINPKAVTYRSNGIVMEVKQQKYQYEVLTIEGNPDFDFLRKNVDKEFHVGYDIEDMSTVVLFEKAANGDYRHVSIAQKYITIHRNKQEQDELDSAFIAAMDKKNKQLRMSMQEDVETILERNGMHPRQHGLNMPQPKGIKRKETSIGKVLKKESELVETEEEINAYNIY